MRPIISTNNSVNYKLASWLSDNLQQCLNRISGFHLINTLDFVSKIRNINLYNKRLISFDVSSLFTNIPVTECINLLERKLPNLNLNFPVPINTLIKLIKLCTKDCFFNFYDSNYEQINGLPMGSPISPALANLFMEFFELDLLFPLLERYNIVWYRYVDDVFAVIPSNLDVDNFLGLLNNLHNSINFTYELEYNMSLPFLDCLIVRTNHFPKFKIFRKATHSNSYIHSFSNHPDNVKTNIISNLFLRGYNICSNEFIDEEIKYVYSTFKNLGYSMRFIDKAHFKARRTYFTRSSNDQNLNKKINATLVLPNLPDLNTIRKIANNLNVRVAVKSDKTIKNELMTSSKIKTINKTSGIYNIKCDECSSFYIGETFNFEQRIYQHTYAKRILDDNNAIVKHMLDKGHNVNVNNFLIMKYVNDTNKRKLLESFFIFNCNNFNIHISNLNFDIISNIILKDSFPHLNKIIKRYSSTRDIT